MTGRTATAAAVRVLLAAVPLIAATVYALTHWPAVHHAATSVRRADRETVVLALAFAAVTFPASAMALLSAVDGSISLADATKVEVAGTFLNRVLPNGLGRVALASQFLARRNIASTRAAAAIAATVAAGFVVHLLGILIAVAASPRRAMSRVVPAPSPLAVLVVVTATVVVACALVRAPPASRLGRCRRWLGGTAADLRTVLRDWRRFARTVAWTAASTTAYAASFCVSLRAVGCTTPLFSLAAAFLIGTAVANAVPAPGGIGPAEVALVAALSTQGTAVATAVAGVLVYRLVSFWLPSAAGAVVWLGMLRRHEIVARPRRAPDHATTDATASLVSAGRTGDEG